MLHNYEIMIYVGSFQDFDNGKELIVEISDSNREIQPGDKIHWVCAQFYGTATVLERNDTKYTIVMN